MAKARKQEPTDFSAARLKRMEEERKSILAAIEQRRKATESKKRESAREKAKIPKERTGEGTRPSRILRKRVPTRVKTKSDPMPMKGRTTGQMKGDKPPLPFKAGRSGRDFGKLTKGKISKSQRKRNINKRRTAQTVGPVTPVGRHPGTALAAMFGDRQALTVTGQGTRPGLAKLGDRLTDLAKELGLPITRKDRQMVIQFLGKLPIDQSAVRGSFDLAKGKLGGVLSTLLASKGLSASSPQGVNAVAFEMWKNAGGPNVGTKPFNAIVDELTSMIKQGSFIQQVQIGTAPIGGQQILGGLPPSSWRSGGMVEWPHMLTATGQNVRKQGERFARKTFVSALPNMTEASFVGATQMGMLKGGETSRSVLLGEKAAVRQLLTGIARFSKGQGGVLTNLMALGLINPQVAAGDLFAAEAITKRSPRNVRGGVVKGVYQGGRAAGMNMNRLTIQKLMETQGTLFAHIARAMRDPATGEITISKRAKAIAEAMHIEVQKQIHPRRIGKEVLGKEGLVTGVVLEESGRTGLFSEKQAAFLRDTGRSTDLTSKATDVERLLAEGMQDPDPVIAAENRRQWEDWKKMRAMEGSEAVKDAAMQRRISKEIGVEMESARGAARAARSGKTRAGVQFAKSIGRGGGAAGLILLALLALPALLGLNEDESRAA